MIFLVLAGVRVCLQFLDIAGIALLGVVLTRMSGRGAFEPTENESSEISAFLAESSVGELVSLLVLLFAGKSVFSVAILHLIATLLSRIEGRLAHQIASIVFQSGLGSLTKLSQPSLQFLVRESSEFAFSSNFHALVVLVGEVFLVTGVSLYLFSINSQVAWFFLLYFGGAMALFQIAVRARTRKIGTDLKKNTVEAFTHLWMLRRVFREVAVQRQISKFVDDFGRARARIAASRALQRTLSNVPRYYFELVVILGAATLFFVTVGNEKEVTSWRDLGIFLFGGFRLLASFVPIQGAISELRIGIPQSREALEFLKLRPAEMLAKTASQNQPLPPTKSSHTSRGGIICQEISFSYTKSARPALEDITFSLSHPSTLAIIGRSGSGKTTLLDVAMGLLTPSAGKFHLPRMESSSGLNNVRNIAYVPQFPQLIRGSLFDNVVLGAPPQADAEAKARSAISVSNLDDLPIYQELGLSAQLGEGHADLSGGQIQRLAIARAIYTGASTIALDEPTSSLDPENVKSMAITLRGLKSSKSMLIAAHSREIVALADYVLLLEKGRQVFLLPTKLALENESFLEIFRLS